MGYTTRFEGQFSITPPLSYEHRAELRARIRDEEWPEIDGVEVPDAYCQWEPTKDGCGLEWDGGEKFYHYDDWIEFLAAFLQTKGYVVTGSVRFRGESFDDCGVLTIVDGKASKSSAPPVAWNKVCEREKAHVIEALADAARGASYDEERDAFAAAMMVLGVPPKNPRSR